MANHDLTKLLDDPDGHDVMGFVEKRIGESDRRRDDNINFKIESIEKLFQMTIEAKSEALATAISRIQGDSKACAQRCASQVKEFYSKIDSLKTRLQKAEFTLNSFSENIKEIESVASGNKLSIEALIDDEIETLKLDIKEISNIVSEIEKWRQNFWLKNILTIIVTTIAVGQILMQGLYWLVDLVKQTMQGGGSV